MTSDIPPLKGKDGIYRVVVHGNCGTGKTTLSDRLGAILQVPVIHLDEVYWRPGWVEAPGDEIIDKLTSEIDKAVQTSSGWVVDGNYEKATKRVMDFAATDIICLLKIPPLFDSIDVS